ncbi:MAG: Rrf2 family transcriptional regulator [Deltaproteobacteria bacterium]|nr:Rrf2 family transcriptional regulator [Deltaproteobacteria bacterium]
MIISKRAGSAIHALGYMALKSNNKPVQCREIVLYLKKYTETTALSESYLVKVFQALSKSGFIVGQTGLRGGYRLARAPEEITLFEVIESLDGRLFPENCIISATKCGRQDVCGTYRSLKGIFGKVRNIFKITTIAAIAKEMKKENA